MQYLAIWETHEATKLIYTLLWGKNKVKEAKSFPFSKEVKTFLPFCTPACWVIRLRPRCWSACNYSPGPCHPTVGPLRSQILELLVCALQRVRETSVRYEWWCSRGVTTPHGAYLHAGLAGGRGTEIDFFKKTDFTPTVTSGSCKK